MVRYAYIKPYCSEDHFHRRKALLLNRFREEWKRDNVIFDLLTAIALFKPNPTRQHDCQRIMAEQNRYSTLLARYLGVKYSTKEEARQCYHQLMENMCEARTLNGEAWNMTQAYSNSLSLLLNFDPL